MWQIGALAKKLGLTVRALHHYDAIGLVAPSERSDAGYRLYSDEDAARLAHVAMLRRLGLGLDDIRACVDAPGADARDAISRHIQELRAQLEEQRALLAKLESIEAHLAAAPEGARLDAIMEAVDMIEKHYTPEQLAQLAERREELGEDALERVQNEWSEVFAGFAAALARGDAPDAPEVQALARRSRELIAMFTGGDAGIEGSLNSMYAQEGGPQVLQGHGYGGVDAELWEYMGEARAALEG
jgi:DNA-binding transcriptional MerR regulator